MEMPMKPKEPSFEGDFIPELSDYLREKCPELDKHPELANSIYKVLDDYGIRTKNWINYMAAQVKYEIMSVVEEELKDFDHFWEPD